MKIKDSPLVTSCWLFLNSPLKVRLSSPNTVLQYVPSLFWYFCFLHFMSLCVWMTNESKYRQTVLYFAWFQSTAAIWMRYPLFFVLLIVHRITVFVNNKFDTKFFFLYSFIPFLYMFRATKCSSSGDSIVSIWHLVYVYVTVCRWHIPDVVLIQLTLLMMGTWLLETCRELE